MTTTYRIVLQEEINGVFRDIVADIVKIDSSFGPHKSEIEKQTRDFIRGWNT